LTVVQRVLLSAVQSVRQMALQTADPKADLRAEQWAAKKVLT
jgi:hypothetical protein